MMCMCGHALLDHQFIDGEQAGECLRRCKCLNYVGVFAQRRGPLMKDGAMPSKNYSDWVRARSCVFCSAPAKSEQHHYPTRGASGGATSDLRSMPVCMSCHLRCGGQVVVTPEGKRLGPISHEAQEAGVLSTFMSFWANAPAALVMLVVGDIFEWRQSRVFIEVPM